MIARGPAIVLIGFMGTGKSTVGRALEARTGWPRYDTDEMVAARFGTEIRDIFARFGEAAFRETESEVIGSLPVGVEAIVVTGGGSILRADNVERLRALGVCVYLHAPEDLLFERLSREGGRPLLDVPDPRSRLRQLLREREQLYADAADVVMDVADVTADTVAELILQRLEQPSGSRRQ